MNYWLEGLVDGHNQADPDFPLNKTQLYLLNSQGDMDDLEYFISNEAMHDKIRKGLFHRCTAAVRITDDKRNIFFSQNTWTSFYSAFIRIAKHYVFHFDFPTDEQNVKFSSYPGLFFSLDDFYMVHNKKDGEQANLAVLETTFHTFNLSLYSEFLDGDGKSVLMWTRVQLANMWAMKSDDWNQTFQYNHSWTYNNGYVLLNYKLYQEVLDDCAKCSAAELEDKIRSAQIIQTLEVVPGNPKYFDVTDTFLNQTFYI